MLQFVPLHMLEFLFVFLELFFVWLCLALPGSAWLCLALPGSAWVCLGLPGSAWLCPRSSELGALVCYFILFYFLFFISTKLTYFYLN
jgi:hypothetical protein